MSLLERIYHFHQELQNNRYPNATTLVEQFEISLATARRDIAYLRDRLLAPLEFSQRKNGFFYTEEGFGLPFEQSPKIVFLLGMLSKMAEEAGLGSLPEVQSLERRLAELVFPEYSKLMDAIHCEWVEVESIQPSIFDAIIEATVKKRVLHIHYRSAQAQSSKRDLEPLRLISYQGRWYLLAYCQMREDIRLFHMARIQEAVLTRATFKRDSSDDFSSYLNSAFGIFKGEVLFVAKILFTSTAAELVRQQRWHRDQIIEEVEDGVLMNLPVSDDRELVMKILQYGAMAKVISPAELRTRIAQEAKAITAIYST